EAARATLARSHEAGRLYLGNGALRPGSIVTYKDLAATLRQIAEGGAEVFYRGPIAKTIARAVREAGGWLGEDDLAAFEPEWREPVTITYRGRRIYSMPPPFSAFQMLETLNILEGYELQAWGHNSVDYLHHLIEAVKLASADRLAYAYAGEAPITGLVLNNILKWMDRDPASPNVVRAGRKAGTMMSPTQVFDDGNFFLSIGTPGSYGILQTTAQMLLNVLEFGMNIQEAIEAPRVRAYRDRLIDAEARIGAEIRDGLAQRGHE